MTQPRITKILFVFLAAGLLFSLARAQGSSPVPDDVRKVIEARCFPCHLGRDAAAQLNLDPAGLPATVVGRPSLGQPGFKVIDPAEPEQSYLLMKVRGSAGIAGKRMPQDREPLTGAELSSLIGWAASLKGAAVNPAAWVVPAKPTFWGTTLVNLPTTQVIERGKFLFRISHRYRPSVKEGYAKFFGLDGPSYVLDGIGFGVTDKFSLTLDRSNLYQEVDLAGHYAILSEAEDYPVSLTIHAGLSLVTEKTEGRSLLDGANFKIHVAVSLARKLTEQISFLVVPAYCSNANHWDTERDGVFSLGLGGRFMVFNDFSIIAEWVPVLAGYANPANGWGFGIEAKIGGHVFQFFVLNSDGVTPSQFLPGGDLLIKNGDLRIGFNIYRTF